MKVSLQAIHLLFVSSTVWMIPSIVEAGCSFSRMEGAEDSPMNPHKKKQRRLGGGGGGRDRHRDGPSPPGPSPSPPPPFPLTSIRSIDGEETLAVTFTPYLRLTFADYADGLGAMKDGPNPRAITNAAMYDNHIAGPSPGISDMFWQWGQLYVLAIVSELVCV